MNRDNSGAPRPDRDSPDSRLPDILPGSRQYSLAAIRERIEEEFIAETSARPDILREAATDFVRRELIREVADYVLAVEGLKLSRGERVDLLDALHADLFSLGPFDRFLADETVNELTIDGPDRGYVRRGANDMVAVDARFDDAAHLERVVRRVLLIAGAELSDSAPFIEVGAVLRGRPARLTVAAPPATPMLHIDVRLHPVQPVSLAACASAGMFDQTAARLLERILRAGHGMMIAGDVGTGKTTVLEALLPSLTGSVMCVERAIEMRVPEGTSRLAVVPAATGKSPVEFAEQIRVATEKKPNWLVVDEIRFDEASAMWQALTASGDMHCLWAFRGATEALRLRTAFGMSVRRAQPGIDQALIHSALLNCLPFVVLMARRNQQLRMISINEWQLAPDSADALVLRTLWPAPAEGAQGTPEPMHKLGS